MCVYVCQLIKLEDRHDVVGWECDSVCMCGSGAGSLCAHSRLKLCLHKPVFSWSGKFKWGQWIFFSVVFTPSPPQPPRLYLAPTCHLLTNTVSPVWACLIIWRERFRETQKEDDRMPLFIHYSLGITVQIWPTLYKRLAVFPSPAGMSLTKLSLAGNI